MSSGPVYTDMGADLQMVDPEGKATPLPRYGVWRWDAMRRKHQVAETSEDLQALRAKHGEGPLVCIQHLRAKTA